MSRGVQRNPVEVSVESLHEGSAIEQKLYEVPAGQRLDALTWLLSHYQPGSCVVFCTPSAPATGGRPSGRQGLLGAGAERRSGAAQAGSGAGALRQWQRHHTGGHRRGRPRAGHQELGAVINYRLTYDPECMCTASAHRSRRPAGPGPEPLPAQRGPARQLYRGVPESADAAWRSRQDRPRDQTDRAADGDPLHRRGPQSKVRAGDILGALTGEGGIAGADVGKIQIAEQYSYVAVRRGAAKAALKRLQEGKIRGAATVPANWAKVQTTGAAPAPVSYSSVPMTAGQVP